MTKKLLLLCALFVMCVGRISAQSEENVWHIATDTYQYIPMNEVSYLLFVDDDVLFSIVKTNGEIVTDVRHVYFRNVPLAVEGIYRIAVISVKTVLCGYPHHTVFIDIYVIYGYM